MIDIVAKHGTDAWWSMEIEELLPEHLRGGEYVLVIFSNGFSHLCPWVDIGIESEELLPWHLREGGERELSPSVSSPWVLRCALPGKRLSTPVSPHSLLLQKADERPPP